MFPPLRRARGASGKSGRRNHAQNRVQQEPSLIADEIGGADYGNLGAGDGQFFLGFPQRAVYGRFSGLGTAAGEADLAGLPHTGGTHFKEEVETVRLFHQRTEYSKHMPGAH